MFRVAVTGASGFIGSHVVASLRPYGLQTFVSGRNLAKLREKFGWANAVELDIASPPGDCFERLGRPDILIHLAWDGLPNYKSPHHVEEEFPRQLAFLTSMVEAGLPALLVTGTCFEYGMQSGALSESLPSCPGNAYGVAKNSLREALQHLAKRRRFALTWARLFYTYGAGQAASSLFPQLVSAITRGAPTFDMSGGEQLRDFLPVETLAEILVKIALARQDTGIVNICSGKPVSVRQIVEQWIQENNWKISLNLGRYPYPDYEPMAFWGDNTYLHSLLERGNSDEPRH